MSTLPCKTYRTSFVTVHYILFHQAVDCWHQIFTNCRNNSFQQSRTVSVVFTDVGNHAGEGLQQGVDCKCWRTSPEHRGRVGTSWSAHYRRRSEGVAKTTASMCCCWRRTVWTWTVTPGTNRKPVCDFLLVINSNWHPISYRFGVIAAYCSNFPQRGHFDSKFYVEGVVPHQSFLHR